MIKKNDNLIQLALNLFTDDLQEFFFTLFDGELNHPVSCLKIQN